MSLGNVILSARKLNNIGRWANEFLHRRASVAEHSFAVAQIAQMLGFIEESHGAQVDWKVLYRKALNHDIPEAVVGDVISTTKNINAQIQETIRQVEESLVEEMLLSGLPEPYKELYRFAFFDGKDESLEGLILRSADNIDALVECLQEISLANADPFVDKYYFILNKIKASPLKSVEYFLKEILPQLVGQCKVQM